MKKAVRDHWAGCDGSWSMKVFQGAPLGVDWMWRPSQIDLLERPVTPAAERDLEPDWWVRARNESRCIRLSIRSRQGQLGTHYVRNHGTHGSRSDRVVLDPERLRPFWPSDRPLVHIDRPKIPRASEGTRAFRFANCNEVV